MIKIEKKDTSKGEISLITLTNRKGHSVVLCNIGAAIVEVNVPDKDGKIEDIVLGYKDLEDYFYDGPCAGKCPGRYANRIAHGKFELDGFSYSLPINNGPNHLHGGPDGFQNKIWEIEETTENSVIFKYVSPDGEAGYPGELTVEVKYEWTDSDELKLTFEASVVGKPTAINLTNHAYWNLKGHDKGSILNHKLKLKASNYLPTDETLIPNGELADVKNTPMDFNLFKTIGKEIKADFPALKYGKGYDNCWVIDEYEAGKLQAVAQLYDEETRRLLTVETDQPGVQVYTGNWLAGSPENKKGRSYEDYDGVAIECQAFPDAPNKPMFPTTVLRPGDKFEKHINFIFSICK